MTVAEAADLAWQLADLAAPLMESAARTTVCAELGAGEHTRAIELVLPWLAMVREQLSPDVATRLHRWLDCYAGDPNEPRLRRLAQAAATSSTGRVAAS